ncbi:Protein of unknown function [Noviherbaspirillum humi]|uniref:DUF2846 domain-containing protein n=1 Tax=Noviherbaspirillum humi TaxID=1688639 RepID=A0A239L3D8_9BURK|nr:DUF2846 domain-containing protein [Noviherbaspirillum humi]SNT24971.1 Protein of unknown function [Noviherbaspirillum humi]
MKTMRLISHITLILLVLAGCATAPGPKFDGLSKVEENWSNVYLYRASNFVSNATAFTVLLNGEKVGELYNGSYLWFKLKPGLHSLRVDPSSMAGPTTVFAKQSVEKFEAKSGEQKFYQFNFQTGLLANSFYLGSGLEERSPEVALNDLKELNLAAASTGVPISSTRFARRADIDDVNAVPYLGEKGRAAYEKWLRQRFPRAFFIGEGGMWVSTSGPFGNSPDEPKDPVERGKYLCKKRSYVNCQLYAVDRDTVSEKP